MRLLSVHRYRCTYCQKRFYSRGLAAAPQHAKLPAKPAPPLENPSNPQSEFSEGHGIVESRHFSRLPCRIAARVKIGSGSVIPSVVIDISLSGCFIVMTDPPVAGDQIEVSLDVAGGMRSPGLVQRSLPTRGIGIQFVHMTVPNFRKLQYLARESIQLQ